MILFQNKKLHDYFFAKVNASDLKKNQRKKLSGTITVLLSTVMPIRQWYY